MGWNLQESKKSRSGEGHTLWLRAQCMACLIKSNRACLKSCMMDNSIILHIHVQFPWLIRFHQHRNLAKTEFNQTFLISLQYWRCWNSTNFTFIPTVGILDIAMYFWRYHWHVLKCINIINFIWNYYIHNAWWVKVTNWYKM